jgi:hypothetical protein
MPRERLAMRAFKNKPTMTMNIRSIEWNANEETLQFVQGTIVLIASVRD